MANVVLCRIDDRLIHGQIMTAWVQFENANHIIIVDDETAKDEFTIEIMKMSVPKGIRLSVCSVDKGGELINSISGGERVIILAKVPETFLALYRQGVKLPGVIIGGMGSKRNRKKLYKNISASGDERETFKKLLDEGVDVKIHILPEDKPKAIHDLI